MEGRFPPQHWVFIHIEKALLQSLEFEDLKATLSYQCDGGMLAPELEILDFKGYLQGLAT